MRSLSLRATVLAALVGAVACGKSSTNTSPSPPATPTSPGVALSVSALTFNTQAVGTASASQTVTVSNGTTPLNVSGVAVGGDFSQTNTCGSSLAAGATCTVTVIFTPSAVGTRTGALTITDDASTSPQVVALAGTGGMGQIALTPTTLSFSNLVVGSSGTQTVTIRNSGGATVNLFGVTTSGDFTQVSNCSTSVVAGSTCLINVKFSPSATGSRTGTLTINDDAPGSPHTVSLTGTGLAQGPSVFLIQNPLTFPPQAVGTSSRPSTVQFTNIGTGTLSISSIVASGDFSQTNSCGATIAANGICTLSVVFTPTAAGARTGAVTITDNAPGGAQTIVLAGTGTDSSSAQGPLAALSPPNVSFANQAVGSTSAPQTVTLTNTGAAPLAITGIAGSDDFGQTNACGATIAAGGNCAIKVVFTPREAGSRAGTLTIGDSAPGSPHTVLLSGTGTGGSNAPAVSLSPSNVAFGAVRLGTTSNTQTVSITNSGKATLNIASLTVDGDFSETDTCGYSIAAGASCNLVLRFTPAAVGTRTGRVTIIDDAPTSPQTITMSGAGALGQISLSPTSLTFVSQGVGTTSDAQTVTVTNSGDASVTILSVTASGDFTPTNNCTGPVAAGGSSCTITVTFTPSATGTRTGALVIVDDAPGSPHAVVLSGIGSS